MANFIIVTKPERSTALLFIWHYKNGGGGGGGGGGGYGDAKIHLFFFLSASTNKIWIPPIH